jgi:hypothetical protein
VTSHVRSSTVTSTMRFVRIGRGSAALRARKARSHGSSAPAGRSQALLIASLVALVASLIVSVTPAAATRAHFFLEDFGSAEKPAFGNVASLTVDQTTGDLLVLDSSTQTLRRFHPDGTPDPFTVTGSNVIDGEGLGDGGAGPLLFGESGEAAQIAVDESGTATNGNIYVAQARKELVDIFASTGSYLGQLTHFKEGKDASGSTQPLSFSRGVAVAPSGAVYVGSGGEVHKYVPSGAAPVDSDNVENLGGLFQAGILALGAGPTAGYIFVGEASTELVKLDLATGQIQYAVDPFPTMGLAVDPATGELYAIEPGSSNLNQYDVSGTHNAVLVNVIERGPTGSEGPSTGVAVDGNSGRLFTAESFREHVWVYSPLLSEADLSLLPASEVTASRARIRANVSPDGSALTSCQFELGSVESGTFSSALPCEEQVDPQGGKQAVSALFTALPRDAAEYQYRLVVTNADGRTSQSEVGKFTLRQPAVTSSPTEVTTNSAVMQGIARPEGEAVTACLFEYGSDTSYGATVTCSPPPAAISADFEPHLLSASVTGLAEFTPYHYRVKFTTAAGTFAGKDEVFRTHGPSGLPDNRRYEQVTPVDKNHSDIFPFQSVASSDGNGLVTTSAGAFAGSPTALLLGVQYLSRRTPTGWTTEGISLPGGELGGDSGYETFSEDLSKGVIEWLENTQLGPHDPNAVKGENIYLHDSATKTFTLLNGTESQIHFQGHGVVLGSSNFSHIAFTDGHALTPEAQQTGCAAKVGIPQCAYEWVNGTLRLASIVNGQPVEGAVGSYFAANPCGSEHAISNDGSRIFFSSPPSEPQLYARENGTATAALGGSERTLPGGAVGGATYFQNAEAAHGNRVLFTTTNALVDNDNDTTNDLYLYDYSKQVGERLTLISADDNPAAPSGAEVNGPIGCGGVAGASGDLRRVYFIAQNQIVAGESETAGPKLFLWDDTGTTPTVSYIATLNPSDDRDWQPVLNSGGTVRESRLSPDGRYLAFISTAKLTGFDNGGRREVYRYDALSGSLECASCSADASPAEGEVGFGSTGGAVSGRAVWNQVSHAISESGQVFFQTARGLIPQDSNGKTDVYEYESGYLSLISSGEGAEDSDFLDASPSGRDVFFTTTDRLVGWDADENVDAYDARVDGGFPEPALAPSNCAGDACQPAPNPPIDSTPASSSFEGAGNVGEEPVKRHCAKGKGRRHGHCAKRRKQAKHGHHRRSPTRSHG